MSDHIVECPACEGSGRILLAGAALTRPENQTWVSRRRRGPAAVQDATSGDRERYALKRLAALGAPRRWRHECADYIARLKDSG